MASQVLDIDLVSTSNAKPCKMKAGTGVLNATEIIKLNPTISIQMPNQMV